MSDPEDISWGQPQPPVLSNQDAEFHRFARLFPEIRCQIWRASWTPRKFTPFEYGISRMSPGRNGVLRLLRARLPVTACVNHESRWETLHKYSRIPTSHLRLSHDMSIYDNSDFMNFEIDAIRFDCCPLDRMPACKFPSAVLQHIQRIEATLPCRRTFYPIECGWSQKSFDNFLRHVVAAYFPSLRELAVELNLCLTIANNVSFLVRGTSGMEVARTVGEKSLFIRTAGGGGVHISMSANSHRGGQWKTVKLLLMKEQEAARYQNSASADPENYRDFLDRLGTYLWHIFTIEGFFWGDKTVWGLLLQHRQHFSCQ
ncbi:hypothetical protein PG984_004913 [Apiospora sp. TS-2023a]